jgi:hypothetical protein
LEEENIAYIYGKSGAERNLISNCPAEIENIEDIQPLLTNSKNKLETSRKTFFNNLPELIKKEKGKLEILTNNRIRIERDWDEKIISIRKTLEENKFRVWLYFDIFFKKHVSKPRDIKNVEIEIENKKEFIDELENEPDTVFTRQQVDLIKKIDQLGRNVKSPEYSGAIGEIKVLNELKKLNHSYHVFCDSNIRLKDYVRYRGTRNLKSAQMDFVIVGPTGIFVIEVKNWSSDRINHHTGISPHEQVDRAGLVLWIYLKQHSFFFKPRITKLLVPIQHNLQYNPNFKSVLIRDHYNLTKFINGNSNNLSERRIGKIASLLERC